MSETLLEVFGLQEAVLRDLKFDRRLAKAASTIASGMGGTATKPRKSGTGWVVVRIKGIASKKFPAFVKALGEESKRKWKSSTDYKGRKRIVSGRGKNEAAISRTRGGYEIWISADDPTYGF